MTAPPAQPKARAATTHRVVPHSKARPDKKKAVVHTRVAVKKPSVKPAVTFLPNPPLVNPVVPAGGRDSGWNLSDADILLIAFLLPLAVALLAWAGWRLLRFQWWGWQYKRRYSWEDSEALEDVQTVLQPRLRGRKKPDGSRGASAADDPVSVARRVGAGTSTGT